MKKLLLVIDAQRDFINDSNIDVLNRIEKLINANEFDDVLFTRFINSKESNWYKKLNYKGCMSNKGREILLDTKNYKIIDKTIYSAVNWELENYINNNDIEQIYICGFETDACVQKTAIDLFEKDYDVYVLKNYCTSYNKELHKVIIDNLKRLIGENNVI